MEKERFPQPTGKEVFDWYLDDFNLNINDLKDKSILDVGSGMVPEFVEYCLKNDITQKIYAIDDRPFGHEFVYYGRDYDNPHLEKNKELEDHESKKHYIQSKGESLPFIKDTKFDFIFMRASLNDEASVAPRIQETTKYLKKGGELRIAPVFEERPIYDELKNATGNLGQGEFEVIWDDKVVKRDVKEKAFLVIIRKTQ